MGLSRWPQHLHKVLQHAGALAELLCHMMAAFPREDVETDSFLMMWAWKLQNVISVHYNGESNYEGWAIFTGREIQLSVFMWEVANPS